MGKKRLEVFRWILLMRAGVGEGFEGSRGYGVGGYRGRDEYRMMLDSMVDR